MIESQKPKKKKGEIDKINFKKSAQVTLYVNVNDIVKSKPYLMKEELLIKYVAH